MPETLEGYLERIVYFNEQNNYTVAKVKVRGSPELVTVVGQMGSLAPGEELRLSGTWETRTSESWPTSSFRRFSSSACS